MGGDVPRGDGLMPPDNRVHVGAAAIVADMGRLLMIERAGTDGHATWSVPGGWIEHADRTVESAAEREVREETRVWCDAYAAAGHTLHEMSPPSPFAGHLAVTCFVICRYLHGDPVVAEPDKCMAVEWVPFDDVIDRPLFAPLAQWWAANGDHLKLAD